MEHARYVVYHEKSKPTNHGYTRRRGDKQKALKTYSIE
jgi:hypothetical protein